MSLPSESDNQQETTKQNEHICFTGCRCGRAENITATTMTQTEFRKQYALFKAEAFNKPGQIIFNRLYLNQGGLTIARNTFISWNKEWGWGYTIYKRGANNEWVIQEFVPLDETKNPIK